MEALLLRLLEYGTTPVLIVLAFLVGFLIKKQNENAKADAARSAEFRKSIEEQARQNEERFAEHERQFASIRAEYTKNADFRRELSGWRTEINRLSDLITSQFMNFTKNIIEIWKEKKE